MTKPLSKQNGTELRTTAEAEGVAIPAGAINKDIVALIEAARAANSGTSQAEPTHPQPMDAQGRRLDEFGLPVSGPARAAALATLGKPDPRDDPSGWAEPASPTQPAADPAGVGA